jgi:hypothetical protein
LNARTKDRLFHFLSRPALLGLALSVFLWGLEYKLSLYEQRSHQVPTAKLLSRNEQVEISAERSTAELTRPMAEGAAWAMAAVPMLLLAALSLPVAVRLELALDAPRKPRRVKFAALFVRPPPCLIVIE